MIGMAAEKPRWRALSITALGVGLALLDWHLLTMPIDIAAIAPRAPESAGEAASAEAPAAHGAAGSAAAFPATLARPLFRADRRPPELAKPEVAQAGPDKPQAQSQLPQGLALVGIVQDGGEAGRALIRSGLSDTGTWVGIGYVLDGWRLSRIETSSIQFEAGGRKQTLSLFPQKAE